MDEQDREGRLERLTKPAARAGIDPRYSRFIRRMRFTLPVIAVMIMAVVFSWNAMNDPRIVPVKEGDNIPKTVGKNELLSPRFESMDDQGQPYTITASRALQERGNEDMVVLDDPTADMQLNSGHWVAIKAHQGHFAQKEQNLLLHGDVEIFHDDGYQLETETMTINIKSSTAHSDTDVRAHGPAGTLEAKGLEGWSETGRLVFAGPAKLVLNTEGRTLDMKGFAP